MRLSINCVTACDNYSISQMLNKFEIRLGADPVQLTGQLTNFLREHQAFFDRFIVLYLAEDAEVISPLFKEKLVIAPEMKKKAILSPLLFASIAHYLGNLKDLQFPPTFIEDRDRIVQVIALTYDHFLKRIPRLLLEEIPTCIVLLNLDQMCYYTPGLVLVAHKYLPKLSHWCAYFGLTQHRSNSSFYLWLARSLGKEPVVPRPRGDLTEFKDWIFTTFIQGFKDWAGNPQLPPTFHVPLRKVWDDLFDPRVLFSDTPLAQKRHKILAIKRRRFGKRNWERLRQFAYAFFIGEQLGKKNERFLIITNSFNERTWEAFVKEVRFPDYDPAFTPTFIPLEKLTTKTVRFTEPFDHIILDFGDEIAEWLPSPTLYSVLELLKWVQTRLPQTSVTFFHPFLVTSTTMKWLVTSPPLPLSLTQMGPEVHRQELVYRTILFTTPKRVTKREFYRNLRASWLQVYHDLEPANALKKEIKQLRLLGLLDRVHYHTTKLGQFFLDQEFSITSFAAFLAQHLPVLFDQVLSRHMPKRLFLQFYLTCTAWYYSGKPAEEGDELEWLEFVKRVHESCSIHFIPPEIEDKAIDMVEDLEGVEDEEISAIVAEYLGKVSNEETLEALSFREKKRSKALIWALRDILAWKKAFQNQTAPIPASPYFYVRQKARKTAADKDGVSEAGYVRAVERIFDAKYLPSAKCFANQPLIPHYDLPVPRVVRQLRRLLAIHSIKLTNNRGSQVLVFREAAARTWQATMPFPFSFEYLHHSCQECRYFHVRRKRHCILLRPFARDQDLPTPCKDRTDIQKPTFSSKVGCPLWRSKRPVTKLGGQPPPKYCYHCQRRLIRVRGQPYIFCPCETEYHLIHHPETRELLGFTYNLITDHNPTHELALLFPDKDVGIVVEGDPLEVPAKHRYSETSQEDFLQVKNLPVYLQVSSSYGLGYDPKEDKLEVVDTHGEVHFYDPAKLRLIDTPRLTDGLLEFVGKHPQIEIVHRTHRLTLSPDDTAQIIIGNESVPLLQVRRRETRILRYEVPLTEVESVFNAGKPRLIKLLRQYGVRSIYRSTRGISRDPHDSITEALTLEGVRPVLREIHLLGLVISVLRASSHLIGLLYQHRQPTRGIKLLNRLKFILMRSPQRLYQYYRPYLPGYQPSWRQQSGLEGWIFRPFAESLREFASSLNTTGRPMLDKPSKEGRNTVRRVWKHARDTADYYAGYTPFDAALNSIHRPLRYHFRSINARAGFGFHTVPLFSHRAHDKPGKSGHLDLEEVGRILSRFVLLEAIVTGELNPYSFEPRLDDYLFTYYAPYARTLQRIRSTFVHKRLFQTPVRYKGRWFLFKDAHRHHVKHLRWCLEACAHRDSPSDRRKFLLTNYRPLMFHVPPVSEEVNNIQEELFFLFEYNWMHRTQKLWHRVGVEPISVQHYLIHPSLGKRLLSIK